MIEIDIKDAPNNNNRSGNNTCCLASLAKAKTKQQEVLDDDQTIKNNNTFKASYDRGDIKPTKKRYLILLLFCLHSMINAAQWIYLCSITNVVAKYYQVDNLAINWTSMVYMLVYVPLIVPASWLFEKIGMRNSILIGSFGTTIGSIIKCFSCQQNRFYLLMSGQTLVATSQLFVLSVPPRLASIWFPDNQVSLANACGVFGNQFGIAMGFVIPQLVVMVNELDSLTNIELGLFRLFLGIAIFSSITSVLILFLFDQTPSKAPGLARLQQIKQENFIANEAATLAAAAGTISLVKSSPGGGSCSGHQFSSLLYDLITERNFFLLMISYGLNVGVFYAISTVLNQMILPKTIDEITLVGRLGVVMVISGMFGSVISGYILDRTHLYRFVNTALYLLSFISIIIFAIIIQLRNTVALYFTVSLLGYFMTGYLLIGFEMSNEITWPKPESVSAGLLNLSAQVFGVVLTYLGSTIVDTKGNLEANLFFCSAIFLGLMVTFMIKAQLKRQNAVDT